MNHSILASPEDFEFHDAVLTLLSWEGDCLTVRASYLNIHKNASPDRQKTDMELDETRLTFSGIDILEFEPSRTWERNENGELFTKDPQILYTGTDASDRFAAELRHTVRVIGLTGENGLYELGAAGMDPYFSVRFRFSSLRAEFGGYLRPAWYENKS